MTAAPGDDLAISVLSVLKHCLMLHSLWSRSVLGSSREKARLSCLTYQSSWGRKEWSGNYRDQLERNHGLRTPACFVERKAVNLYFRAATSS